MFGITLIQGVLTKVPFVPTRKKVTKRLLEIAKLKDGQTILDLGCGDGRLLFEAEKQAKIKAIGYEISPLPYFLSRTKKLFKRSKVEFRFKNFFKENISEADVIFLYLIPDILPDLAKKLKKECKKGTKIISHTFALHELKPKQTIKKDKTQKLPSFYIYKI